MLFYGPSGAGKKTQIACVLRELFGKGVEKVRGALCFGDQVSGIGGADCCICMDASSWAVRQCIRYTTNHAMTSAAQN